MVLNEVHLHINNQTQINETDLFFFYLANSLLSAERLQLLHTCLSTLPLKWGQIFEFSLRSHWDSFGTGVQ